MDGKRLHTMRVAVLVTDGFEQVELTEPMRALREAGAMPVIVSPKSDKVQGMNHTEKGDQFDVNVPMDEADPKSFDAVLLPGGVVNADHLRVEADAQNFVREVDGAGKPIAVICHGPWLLVSAGLVRGRTMTSYHTLADDIRNAGGTWQDRAVVRDSNWVSSRMPDDIPGFNQEMINLFGEYRERRDESRAA